MARTIVVTGGDRAYFLMGCMLVHSLKRWAPRLPVYFLDFGLDRQQRKFLDTICTVVRRPATLPAGLHQYAYKAAMGEFLRPIDRTTTIWLDSDMIAVGPVVTLWRPCGESTSMANPIAQSPLPISRGAQLQGSHSTTDDDGDACIDCWPPSQRPAATDRRDSAGGGR